MRDVSHRQKTFAIKRNRQCSLSELWAKKGRHQLVLIFSDDPEFSDEVIQKQSHHLCKVT